MTVSLFAKNSSLQFGRKINPLDYSKAFVPNSLRTYSSSLEGAMELKFAPFYSPRDALYDDIIVCQNRCTKYQFFQLLGQNTCPHNNTNTFTLMYELTCCFSSSLVGVK